MNNYHIFILFIVFSFINAIIINKHTYQSYATNYTHERLGLVMNIKDIYEAFNKIGTVVFATLDKDAPQTRMAHFRAYDDDGIYFMTMYTKSFYKQLKEGKRVSVCGLCANSTTIEHADNGEYIFKPGYAIRLTGEVKEITLEEIKAKNNPMFDMGIKDVAKYPAMVTFCITKARGDVFDYDFEKISRENKIQRTYFSYGGWDIVTTGMLIDNNRCISCGRCEEVCSFKAVKNENNSYCIDTSRCDECGDCLLACPSEAISYGNK